MIKNRQSPGNGIASAALIICLCCLVSTRPLSGQDEALVLGDEFFSELTAADAIKRDDLLHSRLGKLVSGIITVKNVDDYRRYEVPYRITAEDEREGMKIVYYLFTGNQRNKNKFRPGKTFPFAGKLMLYTPLTLKKDAYILDIKLSDD